MFKSSNKIVLSLFLSAILVLGFSSLNEAFSHASGKTINSGVGTPTIDGSITGSEWSTAGTLDFNAKVFGGGPTPARIFVMNDANNLYVAIRVDRTALDGFNFANVVFDSDHGAESSREIGDESFELFNTGFRDFYWTGTTSFLDTSDGGTNDGSGARANNGVVTVYELSHPLDSTDDTHDFSLGVGNTVGVTFVVVFGTTLGTTTTTFFPAGASNPSLYGDIVLSGVDTTAPTITSGTTTSTTTIDLIASEFVTSTAAPADFTVNGIGVNTVGTVSTSGKDITLTLSSGSMSDTDIITVDYTLA